MKFKSGDIVAWTPVYSGIPQTNRLVYVYDFNAPAALVTTNLDGAECGSSTSELGYAPLSELVLLEARDPPKREYGKGRQPVRQRPSLVDNLEDEQK
jgi:hypothetical protein